MRERFEEVLGFTVSRIVNGDEDGEDSNEEALPRALACFAVGVEESSLYDRKLGGSLKSWKYVAAGVCLREMARWTSRGADRHGSLWAQWDHRLLEPDGPSRLRDCNGYELDERNQLSRNLLAESHDTSTDICIV